MNKLIFKVMFAVLAFVTVGLGSYKMYSSYKAANMSEEELLMMENVLALSENHSELKFISKHYVYRLNMTHVNWVYEKGKKVGEIVYFSTETGWWQTCDKVSDKNLPKCYNDVCTTEACALANGYELTKPTLEGETYISL